MYYSIGIKIKALESAKIKLFTGKKLQAVFLSLIGEEQPHLSKKLHDGQELKNYTVSPLLGVEDGIITKNKNYFFRVTFLDESLFNAFIKKVATNMFTKKTIRLEQCKFTIDEIIYKDSDLARNGLLIDKCDKKIKIKFMSPTMFKNGDIYVRHPEMKYLFRSLLNKYNKYYKDSIGEEILEKLHLVNFESLNVRLKRVQMKNYFLEGFVGGCVIRIDSKDLEFIKNINKLFQFSFFSGIGQKTTMGFGQIFKTPV